MQPDPDHYYRPPAWSEYPWLFAGFGTKRATPPEGLATLHQVHSANIVTVDRHGPAGDGDALVTNTPGVMVGIKTADCVPILLVDVKNRAVAAAHAGWRGTAQRIVEKAVGALTETFGTLPQNIRAAIGPAIGACCYEVGPEVARQFGEFDSRLGAVQDKVKLDLAAINRWQLLHAGVPESHIYEIGLCTFCASEDFHSFRREKENAGRMISVAGIVGNRS